MGVEVLTDLGGRLRTVGNRARVLEESLVAFAATVSDMPITEQALRGLSQIAKEIADELEGIHKEYVRAVGRAKLGVISNDAHWRVESAIRGYRERVGQCWRLAKGSRGTLIPDAARRQRSAGQRARTRLRPQRSDLGSSRVSRSHPLVAVAGHHRWRANDHRRAAGPDASVAGLEASCLMKRCVSHMNRARAYRARAYRGAKPEIEELFADRPYDSPIPTKR